MRTDAVHLGGLAAVAALLTAGGAVALERADAEVMEAAPAEFTDWVVTYHDELLGQSLLFVLSSGLLLLVVLGLHALLTRAGGGPALLAAGATWVSLSLTAQSMQVAMARTAAAGGDPEVVTALGDLMTVLLLVANLPLVVMLAAAATAGLGSPALPRWFGWLSAVAAALHALPVLSVLATEGPLAPDGLLGYLAYPVFVVWLVAAAVVLLRGRSGGAVGAGSVTPAVHPAAEPAARAGTP